MRHFFCALVIYQRYPWQFLNFWNWEKLISSFELHIKMHQAQKLTMLTASDTTRITDLHCVSRRVEQFFRVNPAEMLQLQRHVHRDQSGYHAHLVHLACHLCHLVHHVHHAHHRKKTILLPPDWHVLVDFELDLSLPPSEAPIQPSYRECKGHSLQASTKELHPSRLIQPTHSNCWSQYWLPWKLSPWRVPPVWQHDKAWQSYSLRLLYVKKLWQQPETSIETSDGKCRLREIATKDPC